MRIVKTDFGTVAIADNLEKAHSSCTIKRERVPVDPTRERVELYIQSIDAYRYQRELIISYSHVAGNSKQWEWRLIAYKHPGQRQEFTLTADEAIRLLDYILELVEKYPTLLFNTDSERGPRNEGFVHFHDRLLLGETPSVKMLK